MIKDGNNHTVNGKDFVLKSSPGKASNYHVAICITHTFDYINTTFFDLMLSLQSKYAFTILRNNMLPIDRNRTVLADIALNNPRITHLLFLDTDIVPNDKNFIDIMVSYDLPIVGLLCTKRLPPYEPIVYRKDAPPEGKMNDFWVGYPRGELVEVDAVGTGCLLVKREVFSKMKKPYFKFVSNYQLDLHQSEDVYFIQNAAQLGYKSYVDTEHTCKHYGPSGWDIDDFDRLTAGKYLVTQDKTEKKNNAE